MNTLENLSPGEVLALANLIAVAIAEGKDQNELNAIANLISIVGSLLETIVTQMIILSKLNTTTSENVAATNESKHGSENV